MVTAQSGCLAPLPPTEQDSPYTALSSLQFESPTSTVARTPKVFSVKSSWVWFSNLIVILLAQKRMQGVPLTVTFRGL